MANCTTCYNLVNANGRSQFQIERINMHEGRNRKIRRTFSALGITVAKLHRTIFGPYSLGNQPSGSVNNKS